uniref:Uncharacterized protein n=1 Tax=Mesocestoides corti TaxID=53468 RepID=A0A5K3ES18_MESCO
MLPPSSSTRALAPLAAAPRLQHQVDLTYDQARNAFVLQSSPDERFEVIPVLCRIRGTQSESAGPSAHPRAPPRSDVRVTTSSAPPRSLPRQFPATADDKSQRCRQLEKTVRDQEKIISLLENELERKQVRAARRRTPARRQGKPPTSMGSASDASSIRYDSARDRRLSCSPSCSSYSLDTSHSASGGASATPAREPLPVLARRVRSLVRDIREDTEASLRRQMRPPPRDDNNNSRH